MTTVRALRRVPTAVGAIAVAEDGTPTGTPVVLWPSLFSDHRLFDPVVPLLADAWRIVRVDGPGFGRSDPPRGDVQPDEYAGVVLELMDALGLDRAFVAGCSWGGQVALHAAVRAPERVRGVLAMNTPLAPSDGRGAARVAGTRWLGASSLWGRGVSRSMIAPINRAQHPARVRAFVAAFADFDPRAAATTARTVLQRSAGFAGVLPRLTVPATVLMGAEDRLYPVERMRPIAELAPGARIEVVPACGHLAPIEAPEAVAAALAELAGRAA